MHQVVSLYRSSVGKKILMALSGVILFMFIVLHMLGNLKVLTGPETQGQPERDQRVLDMVAVHDEERFGSCTNHGACQVACPMGISVDYIARLNRDLLRAAMRAPRRPGAGGHEAA